MTRAPLVCPSFLSANFLEIKKEIASIEKAGADWHHFDVMDGHFVPNLSFGPPVLKTIKGCAQIPLDVHIMVTNPEEVYSQYIDAGADFLSFHLEAAKDPLQLIAKIQERGCKAGVAISPPTDIERIDAVLASVDLVLVMSVNPGFGGQAFMPESLERVAYIHRKLKALGREEAVHLHVDGGVSDQNAKSLYEHGATGLVAGSYVYKHPRRDIAIASLRER